MSDAWESLGPLYGKLGLATSPQIITARRAAAQAGFQAFKRVHLSGMLRAAFGLGDSEGSKPLFDVMRGADPTLDMQPSDKEAQLLAGAILQAEINHKSALGNLTALGVLTASFGGVRQSAVMPDLAKAADQALANAQIGSSGGPTPFVVAKRPDDVNEAVEGLSLMQTNYGQTVTGPIAIAAIKKLADSVDTVQETSVAQANAAIAYTRRLEEELRTYWWVVGGWSDALRKPFKDLDQSEAAIRAGAELAHKTSLPLGLFAAPALIDKVIRQDRKGRLAKTSLSTAVSGIDVAWRTSFKAAAENFGDLLPVTLALHLAAESGDADDWQPRFKRRTGFAATTTLGALDLALQVYREIILGRTLTAAKQ